MSDEANEEFKAIQRAARNDRLLIVAAQIASGSGLHKLADEGDLKSFAERAVKMALEILRTVEALP